MSKNEIEDSQKAFWANHYKEVSDGYEIKNLQDLEDLSSNSHHLRTYMEYNPSYKFLNVDSDTEIFYMGHYNLKEFDLLNIDNQNKIIQKIADSDMKTNPASVKFLSGIMKRKIFNELTSTELVKKIISPDKIFEYINSLKIENGLDAFEESIEFFGTMLNCKAFDKLSENDKNKLVHQIEMSTNNIFKCGKELNDSWERLAIKETSTTESDSYEISCCGINNSPDHITDL